LWRDWAAGAANANPMYFPAFELDQEMNHTPPSLPSRPALHQLACRELSFKPDLFMARRKLKRFRDKRQLQAQIETPTAAVPAPCPVSNALPPLRT